MDDTRIETAIKGKHLVYAKFVRRERRHEDWDALKAVRNNISKMVPNAKKGISTS